jgi:hypothetical protein
VLYRPDTRQTIIILPDDVPLPSGYSTVSRCFLCQLVLSGHLSSKSGSPSALDQSLILSKFQEREDQSTVRTMWYPVRKHVSIRQESQFEFDRSNAWQLWFGRWCIVYGNWRFDFNHPKVCSLWSGRTHIVYGNCVLKFSRPDAPAPRSGCAKPDMEITCSERVSVRTIEPSRLDDVLIQERFLRGNFGNILSHSCPSGRPWSSVQTAPG